MDSAGIKIHLEIPFPGNTKVRIGNGIFLGFQDKTGTVYPFPTIREACEKLSRPIPIIRYADMTGDVVPVGKATKVQWNDDGYIEVDGILDSGGTLDDSGIFKDRVRTSFGGAMEIDAITILH